MESPTQTTSFTVENLQNENRKYAKSIGNFHVLEYVQDASVSPMNAMNEYFMSKMNVRRRQVVIDIDKDHSAVIQAGAMQWMGGNVQATSGVKGIGDFLGKALKGAVTKETAESKELKKKDNQTKRQENRLLYQNMNKY